VPTDLQLFLDSVGEIVFDRVRAARLKSRAIIRQSSGFEVCLMNALLQHRRDFCFGHVNGRHTFAHTDSEAVLSN
jgi:hypothetical protein